MPPFSRATALAAALFAGCLQEPEPDYSRMYVESMRPVLEGNMGLARDYLDMAGQIKKKQVDAAKIREKLKGDLLPRAQALEEQARAVQPGTEQLMQVHGQLVGAWGRRTTAYRGLLKAYEDGDLRAFDEASKANLQARLEEEKYFEAVNDLLEPGGLKLDPFPG